MNIRHPISALAVLFGTFLFLGCSSSTSEDPTSEWEGSWTQVQISGKGVMTDGKMKMLVTVQNQQMTIEYVGGGSVKLDGIYALQLDKTKQPAHVDLVVMQGPSAGKAKRGIFAFEGEQLKMCFGDLNGPRPEYLQALDNATFVILEREKKKE